MQWFLWWVALAAVLHFAWRALEWWNEIIIATDEQLGVNKGIIRTTESVTPITPVTQWNFDRTVGGRLLGYGTFRVQSAGHGAETIKYLPKDVYDAISELFEKAKRR